MRPQASSNLFLVAFSVLLEVGCGGASGDAPSDAPPVPDQGEGVANDVATESDGEALSAGRLRFSCATESLYAGHVKTSPRGTMKAGDAFSISASKAWKDPKGGTTWVFGEWRPCGRPAQAGWVAAEDLSDPHGRCAHDPGARARRCASGSGGGPVFSVQDAAAFDDAVTRGIFRSNALALMPEATRPELAATLAVSIDGVIAYRHAYGAATSPDQPFRLMSVSKPITAAVVRALASRGKFSLQTAVYPYLGLAPLDGQAVTPGIATITVEELLDHAGGWDRRVLDPMTNPAATQAVRRLVGRLPTPADIARYMMTQPLQWAPGTHDVSTDGDAYSNFGYALLGLVVEKATRGTVAGDASAYFDAVHGFLPELGATFGAHTLRADSNPAEPTYHAFDASFAESTCASVLDGSPVACPYGAGYIEAMTAHGGVVASAPAVVRFLAGHWPNGLTALQRAANPAEAKGPVIGGARANGGSCWSGAGHTGLFPGTNTVAKQWDNHLAYVLLMNATAPGLSEEFVAPLDAASKEARGAACR